MKINNYVKGILMYLGGGVGYWLGFVIGGEGRYLISIMNMILIYPIRIIIDFGGGLTKLTGFTIIGMIIGILLVYHIVKKK